MKTCAQCGKDYNKKNGKFCSVDCFAESLKLYRECPVCGKMFSGPRKNKTCSKACQYKSFEGSGNPMFCDSIKTSICKTCGEGFKYSPHQSSGKYCSQKCSYACKERSAKISKTKTQTAYGIKDRVFKGRIRSSNRYKQWRLSVFKRDNYKCVKCGNKGKIQVHHLIPFSVIFREIKIGQFKDLSPLFNVDNGTTLCDACHEMTDSFANSKPLEMHMIDAIYKLFHQEAEGYKDFDAYYRNKTEKIIDHLKAKIQ